MRLIQFHIPNKGWRVGLIEDDTIFDLTDLNPKWDRLYHLFFEARKEGKTIEKYISSSPFRSSASTFIYSNFLERRPGDRRGWLLPAIDHPNPAHCIIAMTGLTHLESVSQRDKMHKNDGLPKTDSQKMFEMGVEGGKPNPGLRGIQPEWVYKGSGMILLQAPTISWISHSLRKMAVRSPRSLAVIL